MWYKKAAEQGDADSLYQLAEIYYQDTRDREERWSAVVKRDLVKAQNYMAQAAALGHRYAKTDLPKIEKALAEARAWEVEFKKFEKKL